MGLRENALLCTFIFGKLQYAHGHHARLYSFTLKTRCDITVSITNSVTPLDLISSPLYLSFAFLHQFYNICNTYLILDFFYHTKGQFHQTLLVINTASLPVCFWWSVSVSKDLKAMYRTSEVYSIFRKAHYPEV